MNYDIDLGAEKLFAAEKDAQKITIEIKTFLQVSFAHEFHSVLGQYLIYVRGLQKVEPERMLYLVIPSYVENRLNEYLFIREIIEELQIRIFIFDEKNKLLQNG